MLQFLFDTDHLTLYEHQHTALGRHLVQHSPHSVGLSAVTAEEVLRGRLATIARHAGGSPLIRAYVRLVDAVQILDQFLIVPFDLACEGRYQQLRALRLRVGTNDLRIAAVALANNLTLLTRNRRDFGLVPGLQLDDWSV